MSILGHLLCERSIPQGGVTFLCYLLTDTLIVRRIGGILGGFILDWSADQPAVVWYLTSSFGLVSSVGFLALGRLINKTESQRKVLEL